MPISFTREEIESKNDYQEKEILPNGVYMMVCSNVEEKIINYSPSLIVSWKTISPREHSGHIFDEMFMYGHQDKKTSGIAKSRMKNLIILAGGSLAESDKGQEQSFDCLFDKEFVTTIVQSKDKRFNNATVRTVRSVNISKEQSSYVRASREDVLNDDVPF